MSSDTRPWMYRNGESRLFDHPDKVPGGGWTRFSFPAEPADDMSSPSVSTDLGSNHSVTDQEKLDRMSRQRLMQVASDCGVIFDIGWTKAQFKNAILEVLNDNLA